MTSETLQRIGRAARAAVPFGAGVGIVALAAALLGESFPASAMYMGVAGYIFGHYEGQKQTVERIRSYLHRWGA